MTALNPLPAQQLYHFCDTGQFTFETTAELEGLGAIIGQARALEAIHFGIGIRKHGYNLFALGPAGSGKHGVVTQLLQQKAASEEAPAEWCYVNNFEQPHRPRKISLPRGQCSQLRRDMVLLIEELRAALPVVFEGDDYRSRIQALENALKERQEQAVEVIRQKAGEKKIALIRTPGGFAFAPTEGEEVISPKEFKNLPEEVKSRLETEIDELQNELQRVLNQIPLWRREARERVTALNREVTMLAVGHFIAELKERYSASAEVLAYLDAAQNDIVENVDEFRRGEEDEGELAALAPRSSWFKRYQVNVLVEHADGGGAPVVYEDNPTYQNLVGRIEHLAMMGALITDFTLIKPGALHRANNGYLVLEAYKVLQHPFSWEALKRALRSKEIHIGSLEQMLSLVSTVSLEPEPIALDLKVVLLGDRILYYLLHQYDPEFKELFKVAADFEDDMRRDPESNQLYARLIATLVQKEKLRPFDRSGVARVIEYSARVSGDSGRLTTHMRSICDLLCESDYWAQQHGRDVVTRADVQTAIDAQIRRSSRILEQIHDSIERRLLLIDSSGAEVGQVNGLSVMDLGDIGFGMPTRITAQVRMGDGDVVDIEREVDLGGPIHSKGVMILSGYLGGRYARHFPLALSASLVFEQSYGEIEGDSASSTELYALLSALSGIPIKQGIAVTGSVNQRGLVQAIGGVNEKIEGYFDVCRLQGLTGEQGVIIPQSNVADLMLRHDVVQAVEAGSFNIYAVSTIDEGIEILSGVAAGREDENGQFPEGSLNYLVTQQLQQFAELRHEFGDEKKGHGDDGKEHPPHDDEGGQGGLPE